MVKKKEKSYGLKADRRYFGRSKNDIIGKNDIIRMIA